MERTCRIQLSSPSGMISPCGPYLKVNTFCQTRPIMVIVTKILRYNRWVRTLEAYDSSLLPVFVTDSPCCIAQYPEWRIFSAQNSSCILYFLSYSLTTVIMIPLSFVVVSSHKIWQIMYSTPNFSNC